MTRYISNIRLKTIKKNVNGAKKALLIYNDNNIYISEPGIGYQPLLIKEYNFDGYNRFKITGELLDLDTKRGKKLIRDAFNYVSDICGGFDLNTYKAVDIYNPKISFILDNDTATILFKLTFDAKDIISIHDRNMRSTILPEKAEVLKSS